MECSLKAKKTLLNISTPLTLVFLFLLVAIPNQKELAAIYLLPKIANSNAMKEAEKVPENLAKIMRLKLDKYIQDMEADLTPPVKEKKKDEGDN
jgi:hypothetical protein